MVQYLLLTTNLIIFLTLLALYLFALHFHNYYIIMFYIIMDGKAAIQYILNNNIEGVIIECGVDSGDFEYLWISELMKNNVVRDIYLYDTFGGLVEPSEFDYTRDDAVIYKMIEIK